MPHPNPNPTRERPARRNERASACVQALALVVCGSDRSASLGLVSQIQLFGPGRCGAPLMVGRRLVALMCALHAVIAMSSIGGGGGDTAEHPIANGYEEQPPTLPAEISALRKR